MSVLPTAALLAAALTTGQLDQITTPGTEPPPVAVEPQQPTTDPAQSVDTSRFERIDEANASVQVTEQRTEQRTVSSPGQPQPETRTVVAAKVVPLTHGLKLKGYIRPDTGLVLQEVLGGSPMLQMSRTGDANLYAAERGDILETIEGVKVASAADYYRGLHAASRKPNKVATVGLRNINDGTVTQFQTRVVPVK